MEYMTTTNIIIAIIVLIVIYIIVLYNGLVSKTNQVRESLSDITVQLKRRYDLIPNLVNTIKGSTNFESSTLEKVIQARNTAMMGGSASLHDQAANENMITGALKSIFALSENYPDLKSNANFLSLQTELSDTENKIQAARRFYNTTVITLNNTLQSFPSNIFAKMFHFTEQEFFDVDENEKEIIKDTVKVDFSK